MSVANTLRSEETLIAALSDVPRLQALIALCQQDNVTPYLVGGAIRDFLFKGELSTDLDVVVPMEKASLLAEELAAQLQAKCICLDEQFQIFRVVCPETQHMVDIAGCIGDTIETDLARRDLTVNAMALNLLTHELLDPFAGRTDLSQGVVRMVSEANLVDDPLRLLRVFRIAADLGFTSIDADTLEAVKAHREALLQAAVERIHYEWMRLLSAHRCFFHVRQLADVGLLEVMFPELTPMHEVPSNQHHHLGLFDHTLELLNQFEQQWDDLPEGLRDHMGLSMNPVVSYRAIVRLGCLFHDVGKPNTMAYLPESDRYTFHGHDRVSEEITEAIAQRMKWSKELTRVVKLLVRWHLYPADVLRPEATDRAKRRFFKRLDEHVPKMLLLALADRYSTQGPAITEDDIVRTRKGLFQLWEDYQRYQAEEKARPVLLTGHEVMALLGLSPSPDVGTILAALNERQMDGDVTTKEQATAWLTDTYLS